MATSELIDRLREALLSADYTVDAVLERIGAAGQAGLHRNSTMPARLQLDGADDPQAAMIKLWPQQVVPSSQLAALPIAELIEHHLLVEQDGGLRATVDLRPYGFVDEAGEWSGWLLSDPTPGLDHHVEPIAGDYVLGVSPASTTLAQLAMPGRFGAVLDLGTGCGVQALHLARRADRVVATDLNPRAVWLAQLGMTLNQIDVELRQGSLYQPVADQSFDLIVTNPPYVMSPPSPEGAQRLLYRESGYLGDRLVEEVVRGAVDRLNPGGSLQVLANWAQLRGEPWQERLAGWAAGSGCDLWVLRREELDVHAYIEMWLTDAGLAGHPSWEARYREWVGYFDRLRIDSVGMGWITLTRSGRADPVVRIEDWPWAVQQPVGPAIARHGTALDAALLDDQALLSSRWRLAEDVVQESIGEPGAADPNHVVLRQTTGLRRALEVNTALGGVLGACDGDLALDQITAAVAELLGQDPSGLAEELLPAVREAIRDQLLLPAPDDEPVT